MSNEKQKLEELKSNCLYRSYISDLSIFISCIIFIYFYMTIYKPDEQKMDTYFLNIEDIKSNAVSKILIGILIILLFVNSIINGSDKKYKYVITPTYIAYGMLMTLICYHNIQKGNKNLVPSYFVIPVILLLFFQSIPQSIKYRIC